jgi:hypothetical protein
VPPTVRSAHEQIAESQRVTPAKVVMQVVMQSIAETTDGRRLVGNRPSSLAFSL